MFYNIKCLGSIIVSARFKMSAPVSVAGQEQSNPEDTDLATRGDPSPIGYVYCAVFLEGQIFSFSRLFEASYECTYLAESLVY